jgi:hypothetical protein
MLLLAAATEHQLTMMVAGAEQPLPITLAGCPDKCGDTSIPFPFGMTPGCFRPGFEIVCNNSFLPPRAFILHFGINQGNYTYTATVMAAGNSPSADYGSRAKTNKLVELVDVSVDRSEVRVRAAVSSLCNISSSLNETHLLGKIEITNLGYETYPFRLSATRNVLIGVGSNVEALMVTSFGQTEETLPSCISELWGSELQYADNGSCSGLGCCVSLVPSLNIFGVELSWRNISARDSITPSTCSYGMVVQRSWYNFSTWDLSGYEGLAGRLDRGVPVVLDFAISNRRGSSSSCPAKGRQPPEGYACVSGNSSCSNTESGRYVCKCWDHYHGNPYIANGCQGTSVPYFIFQKGRLNLLSFLHPGTELKKITLHLLSTRSLIMPFIYHFGYLSFSDIDECEMRKQSEELRQLYPCSSGGICKNTMGGYDCRCKPGMQGDGKTGHCSEKFPLPAKVVVGKHQHITLSVVDFVLSSCSLYLMKFKN